jgi:hypothetical protein
VRILLGMILGILLTVGGAYFYDHRSAATSRIERPMVNWDVVSNNWNGLTARLRQEWNRLSS